MSNETNSSWLTGAPFELPEGSEIIIVRVPAHVEVSALNNVKIADLMPDPKEITNQLSFVTTVGDGKSFAQFTPARSYALVTGPSKKQLQDVGEQVVQTEKRVWVPPKGLAVSRVPFAAPPLKKRTAVAKEPASLSAAAASKSSSKKQKRMEA